MKITASFLSPDQPAPKALQTEPESGQYHLIQYTHSNRWLNMIGKPIQLSTDHPYEYVVATNNDSEQKLKFFADLLQVDEFMDKLHRHIDLYQVQNTDFGLAFHDGFTYHITIKY